MITKLHLCFYELSKNVQDYLKKEIKNNWQMSAKFDDKDYPKEKYADEAVEELLNRNNAGIDVDIYPYMK